MGQTGGRSVEAEVDDSSGAAETQPWLGVDAET